MKSLYLKLLTGVCALGVLSSAEASSPLNWQVGLNIGKRGWDSPGYLKNNINFNVASLSISTGFEKYFASALIEKSLSDRPIELEIDTSKAPPSIPLRNSGTADAGRSEYSFVGGYNFTNSISGFVGYVTSEVNISNLDQFILTTPNLVVTMAGDVKYSSHGPFIGAGYRIPVSDYGALSLSIAYAHLTATGEVGSGATYQQQTIAGGVSSNLQTIDKSAFSDTVNGNASGFSYGASWFGKFPDGTESLHSLRYVVAAKLYKYDYNGASIVPNQTNSDSKETYSVFSVGLTKTF